MALRAADAHTWRLGLARREARGSQAMSGPVARTGSLVWSVVRLAACDPDVAVEACEGLLAVCDRAGVLRPSHGHAQPRRHEGDIEMIVDVVACLSALV